MRYIGNKDNIIERIDSILQQHGVVGKSFCDLFSGTTNVAKYYKRRGYRVSSSDLLYLSYCLQKAYIENNSTPTFEKLLPTLCTHTTSSRLFNTPFEIVSDYLSNLCGIEGFIYKNYTPAGTHSLEQPRKYFSNENGRKIDAIRQKIELWRQEQLLNESEYFILIASLLESVSFYANISGVYAAFQKKWDPRALKELRLREIEIIDNGEENRVYNGDATSILPNIDVDILYLDPPYNARQYLPNYHIVETIAKYDSPQIKGVSGMRDYKDQKSRFCNARTALEDLDRIAREATFKYLVLSYNSEGIMSKEDIIATLSKYGEVTVEEFQNLRFKSNNNGAAKNTKYIFEQLYILKYDKEKE